MDLKKIMGYQSVRYIFFGGCTTMVNLLTYTLLRNLVHMDINSANLCSIFAAILFAYVVNKRFVFESKTENWKDTAREAVQFIGMRLFSLFVEIVGVIFLVGIWSMNDMVGKLIIQFVILAMNYLISKLYVFKDRELPLENEETAVREAKQLRWLVIGSTLLPMLILGIGFAVNEVWPFGDRSVLIIDSAHQYLPFFTEFFRKLKDGDTLLYTFSGGMGTNFWALFAYYLSSPLNLLIMLFNENHIMEGMAFLILLKVGLSGGTFSYYLSKRVRRINVTVPVFSLMFALSSFMIGYYFNIMWLDSIMLFPLVLLGIERLVDGRGSRLYGGVLALTLFCNYYIGFMVCLFSCLYYLILCVLKKKQSIRNFIITSCHFAWNSLLAGGMAAMVLLPGYKALQLTKSVTDSKGFPSEIKFYENWLDLISQHFALIEPVTISEVQGDLNVYCGMFVMIGLFLYLLDKYIPLKERILKGAVCLMLFISFNFNILNFVWHGFHTQNGLPNRFAFLYIALVLIMCFDVVQHVKKLPLIRILISCFIPVAFAAYCMYWGYGDHTIYVYGVTLVLLNIYMWLLALYKLDLLNSKVFRIALAVLIIVEITANTVMGTISNGTIGRTSYLNSMNSYQEMIARVDEDGFYRSEMDGTMIRNEIMYQGGRGVVQFSSTVPAGLIHMMRQMGMEGRTNKSGYAGTTKLLNDIFGIKYLASRVDAVNLSQFERIDETESLYLYQNEDALSLGFMVDANIKYWDVDEGSRVQVQNDFIEKATGYSGIYYYKEEYTLEESDVFVFSLDSNEQAYLDVNREADSIRLTTPYLERSYNSYTNHLYDLGLYENGASVSVDIELEEGSKPLTITLYGYRQEAYQQVYNRLAQNQLDVETFTNSYMKGSIQVTEGGTMLMSLPYDEGWKIKVNGAEVEAYAVGGALTGIDLDPGNFEIEMSYTSPGLWLGTAISVISLFLFFLSGYVLARRGKQFKIVPGMREYMDEVSEESLCAAQTSRLLTESENPNANDTDYDGESERESEEEETLSDEKRAHSADEGMIYEAGNAPSGRRENMTDEESRLPEEAETSFDEEEEQWKDDMDF